MILGAVDLRLGTYEPERKKQNEAYHSEYFLLIFSVHLTIHDSHKKSLLKSYIKKCIQMLILSPFMTHF